MSRRSVKTSVTAHAGCMGTPPNSLESFQMALSYPLDCLEADVRFGGLGLVYLSHDPLPPEQQREAVTLPELLKLVSAHPTVCLNLDMKEYSGMKLVEQQVFEAGLAGRVFLTGITIDVLSSVRRSAPGLPAYLNAVPTLFQRTFAASCDQLVRLIREGGAIGLNTNYRFVTTLLYRTMAESELQLSVWTIDHERDMRRFLTLQVDNITTRQVDKLIDLRSRTPYPHPAREASG